MAILLTLVLPAFIQTQLYSILLMLRAHLRVQKVRFDSMNTEDHEQYLKHLVHRSERQREQRSSFLLYGNTVSPCNRHGLI